MSIVQARLTGNANLLPNDPITLIVRQENGATVRLQFTVPAWSILLAGGMTRAEVLVDGSGTNPGDAA